MTDSGAVEQRGECRPSDDRGFDVWAAIDEIVEFLAVAMVLTTFFDDLELALCGAVGYTMGRLTAPILWADTDRTELEMPL